MTTFSAMDIGRTGIGFAHYWLDTVGHNLANVNTHTSPDDEPFRARLVVARPLDGTPFAATGSGVYVGDVVEQDGDAPLIYDPTHPLADADGNVAAPVMELSGQMTDLIMANRSYQANLRTVETAKEAYQAALRIGQR